MRSFTLPSRKAVQAAVLFTVVTAVALIAGWPRADVTAAAGVVLALGLCWLLLDLWNSSRTWKRAPLRTERKLPNAFALGVPTVLTLGIVNEGDTPWSVEVFDEVDPRFAFDGLPQSVTVPAGGRADIRYTVTALRRGVARFGVTQLRCRSRGASLDVLRSVGESKTIRVYPNFAAVAGYAWLAGDRRLAQIGIKTYAQRGMGTDFRQLSEYRRGDSIRHIDWRPASATASPSCVSSRTTATSACSSCSTAGGGCAPTRARAKPAAATSTRRSTR
jgi:uncharacterized protein (DUF58 family)